MHSKQFFTELLQGELPIFVRLFQALPQSKLGWKAHKRNKTALELLQILSLEAVSLRKLLKTGVMSFDEQPVVKNSADAVKVFKKEFPASVKAVKAISDKDWLNKEVGMPEWKGPFGVMSIHLFLDFIHHRGQLSTYIRPMGGKVPSIYGPSGDSK